MEFYIVLRRVRQRVKPRGILVHSSLVGAYCTSPDMAGVSIGLLHLDSELTGLLKDSCRNAALSLE
jgi:dihydroxyacetone kinase-like protein